MLLPLYMSPYMSHNVFLTMNTYIHAYNYATELKKLKKYTSQSETSEQSLVCFMEKQVEYTIKQ